MPGARYHSDDRTHTAELLQKFDFDDSAQTLSFIDELLNHLGADLRPNRARAANGIQDQLRQGKTEADLLSFLFGLEYLRPVYKLQLNGKDLRQLSPGERGLLLLVFYLLIDKGDVPLIIDQPEENLDNQTAVQVLLPCIRQARQRRQIIIVTHNPNLAVVCDVDQVIHATLSTDPQRSITYTAGSIENPDINRKVVDVLEGTRQAFDNRRSKYQSPGVSISQK